MPIENLDMYKIDIFEAFESFDKINYKYIFAVDILRASTTAVLLYYKGIKKIYFQDDLPAAISLSKTKHTLLIGEIGGVKPKSFNFGNSPYEINLSTINNEIAVHYTTNGTPLFKRFVNMNNSYLASFLNIGNVIKKINGNTAFVLAGTNGEPAYEDRFFAGYIVTLFPHSIWGHGAIQSARIYKKFRYAPEYFFARTKNGKNLVHIGKYYDIKFSLQKDLCPILPHI